MVVVPADSLGGPGGLRWEGWAILGALLLALGLAVYRWWQARGELKERARTQRELEQRLQAIDSARDGFAVVGRSERFIYANEATARTLGFSSARELFGKSWKALFDPEQLARFEQEILPALRREGGWTGEVVCATGMDHPPVLELSLTPMPGGAVTWVVRDAAWRGPASAALRESRDRYRSLVQTAGSAIVLLSPTHEVLEWNCEAERLFGRSRSEALGRDFVAELVPRELRESVTKALDATWSERGRCRLDVPTRGGGRERHILWNVTYVDAGAGGDGGLVAAGHDVTEGKETEEALARRDRLYRLLANNMSDLVALHHPDGRFQYASPSCTQLLGYEADELIGRELYRVVHSDDWKRVQSALAAAQAGRLHRGSMRFRKSTGEYVWFETLVRPIRDESGKVVRLQTSSRDVTERKLFEEQLEYQALHEPLTDLPNRTLFLDRLRQALIRSRREGTSVAVMFLDLDRFKVINDSLGHAAGDRLLTAVASRLRACLREADTVARLGGDEFGVLLEFSIDEHNAARVAERVLEQLQPPFTLSGNEMFVSASIGIAFSNPGIQTAEDLLRFADVAMYRAKDAGAGTYRIFDAEKDVRETRRLERETALRRAIEHDELLVMYQPIVSLHSGRIYGIEALVRWEHPEHGLIGPDEFIPIAEESGLIVPLGYQVMRRACEQATRWARELGRPDLVLSVNLSARQFSEPRLETEVATILEDLDMSPGLLQLEITESELMHSAERVDALKGLGVRLAIDDFGTGYSSLSYLKNLRVDSLKIDRSFVQGLTERPEDAAIVRTVVTLARALRLEVTAEGVETEEELAYLRELGCHNGQGYLFARPSPPEEAVRLIADDPRW
ncbi:MAG: EAL domain-containing protein [Gemmatimonadota bacterium]